jgi:chemotaxis protein methyltransferase CheR
MPGTTISMKDTDFKRLQQVIYDRSGIFFPEQKKYVLESRLSKRLEELEMEDFDQYIAFLTMGPFQVEEFQEMFNRITINETSFFRNQPQLDFFEQRVLPELLKARESTKRLRIWSAACSSGEEPYTIAMQVHRSLGVRLSDWHVEILGTDISERVLRAASEGVYTSFSFRSVSPMVTKRYFSERENVFVLSPEIKEMVTFELHNLNNPTAARRWGTWDVIFCRNVMIYFDDDMKARVAQMFHDQLAPDGYLMIGHSETLRNAGVPLERVDEPQAFAYRRADAAARAA